MRYKPAATVMTPLETEAILLGSVVSVNCMVVSELAEPLAKL
jgi:hypothetical protein